MKINFKKLLLIIFCLSVYFITIPRVYAGQTDLGSAMKYLSRMQGSWYDLEGNEKYTFNNGYVNGNKILNLYDVAGGGGDIGLKLSVSIGGYPEIWHLVFDNLSGDPSQYHQYLHTDGMLYRRTPQERYFESIGGIYLGMTFDQVKALYGLPTLDTDRGHGMHNVGYSQLGMELDIRDSVVTQITIYNFGDRKFDRSGLSAKNSMQDYSNAYGMKDVRTFANKIGHGEYIWLDNLPSSVTLSLYWN